MRIPLPSSGPLLAVLALAAALAAQDALPRLDAGSRFDAVERLDALDHAERLARLALTGDLGLPPLPPVTADSPRDDFTFEDRRPVGQGASPAGLAPGVLVDHVIPAGPGGTGTDKPEKIQYQLGALYDESGPPRPLLVAYHGFGGSAASVAAQSTLDEECNARGWVYLSVTGLDDQLFGSPICQQHVEAAIQYMLDSFHVDAERVCMVGFSMGAGVAASFAARHRDPEGVMIAALGMVSGVSDWTATHKTGSAATKAILEGEFNFGGTPAQQPFRYRQASGMHFGEGSYPPLPGELDRTLSMSTNLEHVPVFLTWDTLDTVPLSKAQNPVRARFLADTCPALVVQKKSGTLDPETGAFAPHSWAVLDEAALLDFFADQRVARRPREVHAQLDRDTGVGLLRVTQAQSGAFTWLDAELSSDGALLALDGVVNADAVRLDAQAAGLGAAPRLDARSSDALGHRAGVFGLDALPSYAVSPVTLALVPDCESDPGTSGATLPVPPHGRLFADLVVDAAWRAELDTQPEPAGVGAAATLTLDGPPGASLALLVVSLVEAPFALPGGSFLLASPVPPAKLVVLPLDSEGDLLLPLVLADEPGLPGTTLRLQALVLDARAQLVALSNMRVVHVLE
ncbi:MAG: alpha/beta hydrolase fold domain-containing protein [Planctomycetes bacterium]|nr:alpha/beta hydrolase fold domain-containing protein [Planctomycetota bacterium]